MPKNRSGGSGGDNVGARIRAARTAKKLTQGQLARPDFSISYISAIERGQIQPSLRALEIIAQRLDLPSSNFFTETFSAQQEKTGASSNGEGYRHVEAVQAQIEYTILEARVLLMEGQTEQAIALLERLRVQTHDSRMHMRLHCLLGHAYLLAGRLAESELELIEAEQMATRNKDSYAALLIHCLLGQGYIARQRIERAVKEYEKCLAILKQLEVPDPFWLCGVYNFLGIYYSQLGDDETAFSMLKEAAQVAGRLAQADYERRSLQHLSQYFTREGYMHRALLYAHKSLLEPSWRAEPSFLARLYLDLGKAMTLSERGETQTWLNERLAANTCHADVQGAILVALGGWEHTHGQIDRAEQLASQALAALASGGDSPITAEALCLLGRASYAQERPEDGYRLCAASIDMLQRLNLQHELVQHAEEFARHLEETGQPRESLHYLKLAYQIRGQMGM